MNIFCQMNDTYINIPCIWKNREVATAFRSLLLSETKDSFREGFNNLLKKRASAYRGWERCLLFCRQVCRLLMRWNFLSHSLMRLTVLFSFFFLIFKHHVFIYCLLPLTLFSSFKVFPTLLPLSYFPFPLSFVFPYLLSPFPFLLSFLLHP